MPFYSVNFEVSGSVTVFVEADDEESAEEIASMYAHTGDAEVHDFTGECEVLELSKEEIPSKANIRIEDR